MKSLDMEFNEDYEARKAAEREKKYFAHWIEGDDAACLDAVRQEVSKRSTPLDDTLTGDEQVAFLCASLRLDDVNFPFSSARAKEADDRLEDPSVFRCLQNLKLEMFKRVFNDAAGAKARAEAATAYAHLQNAQTALRLSTLALTR